MARVPGQVVRLTSNPREGGGRGKKEAGEGREGGGSFGEGGAYWPCGAAGHAGGEPGSGVFAVGGLPIHEEGRGVRAAGKPWRAGVGGSCSLIPWPAGAGTEPVQGPAQASGRRTGVRGWKLGRGP